MPQPDLSPLAQGLREFAYGLLRATRSELMSRTAASTLAMLDRLGATRVTTLAEREAVTQPAMSGLVQRLESAGLVERRADEHDGRVALIAITPAGRQAMQRRRSAQDAVLIDRLADLPAEDLAALETTLPILLTLTETHVH